MAGDHCSENLGQWKIPEVPDCFHGELSRHEAEKRLLRFSIPNSYLLRLSVNENEDTKQVSLYYALSFLTSKLVCQHYKLVPRLQSFQLGERLFQCLKCILSRYYQCPLVPGEYLRVPIPPCSPPQELYTSRVRAIREYEPPCNLRLGCKPNDEFLVVDDESHSDWMFVTSVQTRQSGYLPKFCLERVYPDLIERLPFFHEDSTSLEQQELLKQNGPFSYLLRLCDSDPGLYTLLIYDGSRILKYKIGTSVVWWATPQPERTGGNSVGSTTESSSETTLESRLSPNSEGEETEASASEGEVTKAFAKPLYESVVKIHYNNLWYTSVEKVVAAIEAQFNLPNSPYQPKKVELKPVLRGPKMTPSQDSIYMAVSFNRRPPSPRAFVEIHGELSLWQSQKKKWKTLYASLDREQSILTLTDGDNKRKPERLDLSRCDFIPIHPLMFDKRHCFGLLLSSTGEREDYIFAVEPPFTSGAGSTGGASGFFVPGAPAAAITTGSGPTASCAGNSSTYGHSASLRLQQGNGGASTTSPASMSTSGATTNVACGFGGVNNSNIGAGCSGVMFDLDPLAYAGRTDTGNLDLSTGCPRFCGFGETTGSTWSKIIASSSSTTSGGGSVSGSVAVGAAGGAGPVCGSGPILDLAYMRWLRALAAHCRNTSAESAVDADPERRRSEVRCFRSLEVKLTNAKLLPMSSATRREGGGIYSVTVDGLEIARAYSGATNQTITFEEFPFGYKKVEVTFREDKKKRPTVLAELQLMGRRRSNLMASTSSSTSQFSMGSSPTPEVAMLAGRGSGRGAATNSSTESFEFQGQSAGAGSIFQQQGASVQQVAAVAGKATLPTPICCFQESVSPQAAMIYRELYVLPFQCYDKLRKVITSHLETELVPACTYMWKVLASDQNNFQSSLLLACIESKRHLELIVHLLKAIIPSDNPAGAFRSNALGQLIMEEYMNMVCSEWRQKCFQRVFNEITRGGPPSGLAASDRPDASSAAPGGGGGGSKNSRATPVVAAVEQSSASEAGNPSSSFGINSYNVHSINNVGIELRRVATCPPQHHTETASALNSAAVGSGAQPPPAARSDTATSPHSEWYAALIQLLVDDLLEYAKEFPLQIRWIYSELQKCPELKSTNAVWCNLFFLRGICPFICKGPDLLGYESSPIRDPKPLTTVAKIMIALTSQRRTDHLIPHGVFETCRSKLVNNIAPHVLSPLSVEELNRLEGLYIEEAMRASANSMSRELAQLASYFQLVFLSDSPPTGDCGIFGNAKTLLNKEQLATNPKPFVPNLRESLLELSQFAQSPPTGLHYHHLQQFHSESTTTATAPMTSTSSTTHSRSGGGGNSGVGLMRSLGGIFSSNSLSNPSFL